MSGHDQIQPSEYDGLRQAALFDEAFYRTQVVLPLKSDALRHYLEVGWRWNLRPRDDFESDFIQPFYEASGLEGAPLLHWVALSAQAGRLPCDRAEAQARADLIRPSPYFDAGFYGAALPSGLDPALHYVVVGEALGLHPSARFDPVFYGERYPDVLAAGVHPLLHFVAMGRQEGRLPRSVMDRLEFPALPPSDRPAIVMLVHEASRTGAPILGWSLASRLAEQYDVISVLMRDGDMEADFAGVSAAVVGPIRWEDWHPAEMSRLAQAVVGHYKPRFAISNSIETNLLVPPLAVRGVPSIALVHEFAAYTRPLEKMSNVFDWATDVVFPARIVAQSSYRSFPHLRRRRGIHILSQGRVDPPVSAEEETSEPVVERLRPAGHAGAFVVLGAGSVHIRKGVDIFFAVAAAVRRMAPELDVRFAWIGHGYDPEKDAAYSAYLAEQFEASGLEGMVEMLPPVSDLDPVYAACDMFLLSSRLDPQPNVGIDSILRGLPVVCFEGASGTAEVLGADDETRALIAPHLDAQGAAEIICRFARDPAAQARMRDAVRRVGEAAYDMEAYIAQVARLGEAAASRLRDDDWRVLAGSDALDPDLILPPGETAPGLTGLATIVQQQWAVVGLSPDQAGNRFFRRPCAGFHPQAYAASHADDCGPDGANPTAHWLRRGRPVGTWSREVIEPLHSPVRAAARLAVHAHFFYEELAPDLARRLAVNATGSDLFLTTDTDRKAARLRAAFAHHVGAVTVLVVPNRGRDIGPFLHLLPDLMGYDAVAHLHGKRSSATDGAMGDRWRDFLWENLVGPQFPMLDTIGSVFSARADAGLLMAEEPHLVGWDDNHAIANDLARRMGLPPIEDTFFDFPLGTMFWARPHALRPLTALGLDWDDYPEEPAPYDGTVLHALERLIPFVVKSSGAAVLGVRVPGTTW